MVSSLFLEILAAAADTSQAGDAFVGAIDNGTTSSRFLIFDSKGEPVAQHQIEFEQMYPHSG